MPNNTPKRRRAPKKTDQPNTQAALKALREAHGVEVTEADRQAARQLSAFYHDKNTAPIIKQAVFQLFWDLALFYDVRLPKMFTSRWLPYWQTLLACNRRQGHMPTVIHYTWQPLPSEETELDKQDREEEEARAIFNLIHDERLTPKYEGIANKIMEILDMAHPFNVFEVFRVAWPLALAKLAEKEPDESDG
jgi:3-mercaptopyruvate sulfurtransferase SseA